jgi:hypothetical protein
MDPNTINLIISVLSGIAGGNAAGAAMPDKTLGTLGNSIGGLFGGGIGGFIMKALGLFAAATAAQHTGTAAPASAFDLSTLIASIGGGGVSGALLTGIIAFIKNAMQKPS